MSAAYGKFAWGKSPYGRPIEVLLTSADKLPIVGTMSHEQSRAGALSDETSTAGTISTETGVA